MSDGTVKRKEMDLCVSVYAPFVSTDLITIITSLNMTVPKGVVFVHERLVSVCVGGLWTGLLFSFFFVGRSPFVALLIHSFFFLFCTQSWWEKSKNLGSVSKYLISSGCPGRPSTCGQTPLRISLHEHGLPSVCASEGLNHVQSAAVNSQHSHRRRSLTSPCLPLLFKF